MGELKKWRDQKWVRIDSKGNIAGECGTSKNKKNPDRCLPLAKAKSLSKAQRAVTARKKKKAGARGQQVVSNTKAAKVRNRCRGWYDTGKPQRLWGSNEQPQKEDSVRIGIEDDYIWNNSI